MEAQQKEYIKKDSSYVIIENPQDVYEGIFKENKPYKGYFKQGESEFFTVDYYEKGIRKYTYSLDIMHMFDGGMESELNVKSIYKEGKIYTGVKQYNERDRVIVEEYKKGVITGFYVDVFAMHYYNRIHFTKENDSLMIRSFREKDYWIRVFQKNKNVVAELLHQDVILKRIQGIDPAQSIFPTNSEVSIYKEKEVVKGIAYQNFIQPDNEYMDMVFIQKIFRQLEVQSVQSQWDIFDQFRDAVISGKDFIIERTYDKAAKPLAYFTTTNEGTIKRGIRFYQNKQKDYYQIFKDNKVIKKEDSTLDTFQNTFETYIKTLNSKHGE